MTQAEFEKWQEFYMQSPFDDLHRYHRPAALVSASIGGGRIDERLEWLHPSRVSDEYTDADISTMKAFGFTPPER